MRNKTDPGSLTRSRRSNIVAATCLYMACRIEMKPFLLIDFADAIQDDLYKIAELFSLFRTHMKMKEEVPQIDPSWFIQRFC